VNEKRNEIWSHIFYSATVRLKNSVPFWVPIKRKGLEYEPLFNSFGDLSGN